MFIGNRLVAAALAAVPLAAHAGTFTTLYTFKGEADGSYPNGPLTYHGGALYGIADGSDKVSGSAFKIDATSGHIKVLHTFKGGTDGAWPTGIVFQGSIVYGTTAYGGGTDCNNNNNILGCGTIFSINPKTQVETILYSFPENGGSTGPAAAAYLAGALYGVTGSGGASNVGSIFSFDLATSAFTTLYSFSFADGADPGPQLLYKNGLFYGTTLSGGTICERHIPCGVVFSIDPATDIENTVFNFQTKEMGAVPFSNLAYHAGSLIGSTEVGGSKACKHGCGLNYAIKAAKGTEKILSEGNAYADDPSGITLVGDSVYETLMNAGGFGELVQFDLKSREQNLLYTFTGGSDGSDPIAPLTYHDGAFYGTTLDSPNGRGTVFKYVP